MPAAAPSAELSLQHHGPGTGSPAGGAAGTARLGCNPGIAWLGMSWDSTAWHSSDPASNPGRGHGGAREEGSVQEARVWVQRGNAKG